MKNIRKRFIVEAHHSSKKKIALYGGTFNPPTFGHRLVIEEVLKAGIVDYVWVLPSIGRFKKNVVAYSHRMAMCEMAFGDIDNVSVSSLELALGEKAKGYTANIIYGACEIFPNVDFYFVVGGDTAEIVPTKWFQGQYLTENRKFIILPRLDKKGKRINVREDVWYKKDPHIYLGDINQSSISSTQVRDIYASSNIDQINYQLPFLINKNVQKFIDTHGFYEEEEKWKKRIELNKGKMDLF